MKRYVTHEELIKMSDKEIYEAVKAGDCIEIADPNRDTSKANTPGRSAMKKKTLRKLLKVLEKTNMSFILLFDPTEDDFNSFKRKKRKIKGMKYIYRRLDEET